MSAVGAQRQRTADGSHARYCVSILVALLASPLLAACPNPNGYMTPRTVPKGEVNHAFAA